MWTSLNISQVTQVTPNILKCGKSSRLEQISVVVVVDENLQLLEFVDAFDHFNLGLGQPLPQLSVVLVRDVEELHSALFQVLDLRVIKFIRIEGARADRSPSPKQ